MKLCYLNDELSIIFSKTLLLTILLVYLNKNLSSLFTKNKKRHIRIAPIIILLTFTKPLSKAKYKKSCWHIE